MQPFFIIRIIRTSTNGLQIWHQRMGYSLTTRMLDLLSIFVSWSRPAILTQKTYNPTSLFHPQHLSTYCHVASAHKTTCAHHISILSIFACTSHIFLHTNISDFIFFAFNFNSHSDLRMYMYIFFVTTIVGVEETEMWHWFVRLKNFC